MSLAALLATIRGRAACADGTARCQAASGYPAEALISRARAQAYRVAAKDVEREMTTARSELVTLPEADSTLDLHD